jgi:hypothetical protein
MAAGAVYAYVGSNKESQSRQEGVIIRSLKK